MGGYRIIGGAAFKGTGSELKRVTVCDARGAAVGGGVFCSARTGSGLLCMSSDRLGLSVGFGRCCSDSPSIGFC